MGKKRIKIICPCCGKPMKFGGVFQSLEEAKKKFKGYRIFVDGKEIKQEEPKALANEDDEWSEDDERENGDPVLWL